MVSFNLNDTINWIRKNLKVKQVGYKLDELVQRSVVPTFVEFLNGQGNKLFYIFFFIVAKL
jgi:hypothetical protein